MRRKLLSRLTARASRVVVAAVITSLAFSATAMAAAGDSDPTFSGDGKQKSDFGFGTASAVATVRHDGKIVAAGAPKGFSGFALARYNTNGSLDTSFDGDGKVTAPSAARLRPTASRCKADGKIVAVGDSDRQRRLRPGPLQPRRQPRHDVRRRRQADHRLRRRHDAAPAWRSRPTARSWRVGHAGTGALRAGPLQRRRHARHAFAGDGKLTTDFGGADDEASERGGPGRRQDRRRRGDRRQQRRLRPRPLQRQRLASTHASTATAS